MQTDFIEAHKSKQDGLAETLKPLGAAGPAQHRFRRSKACPQISMMPPRGIRLRALLGLGGELLCSTEAGSPRLGNGGTLERRHPQPRPVRNEPDAAFETSRPPAQPCRTIHPRIAGFGRA